MVQVRGSFPLTATNQKYIQMPKLANLLRQSVNNSSDFDSAWYVRFAYNLHMEVSKAQKLFSDYGLGYIYASTGFVMPDTPHLRRKMVANFGVCVVVASNGDMWIRTPEHIGARNRKKAKRLDNAKRREIRKNEELFREEKRLNRLFKEGQTSPSPKRGGKANSHDGIGRYISIPGVSMENMEPRNINKFVQIRIHI